VTLESIIEASVETARPLIESKQHQLTIELPTEKISLSVDPLRISQSLSNLLTNSAKYTDSGGDIALKVALSSEEITLSVKDTGIGFELDTLPDLFEMFSQVNPAIARSEGGLGIGLALVKGLVGLHEGRVDATSAGPGLGSEFTIHLPRSLVVMETTSNAVEVAQLSSKEELQHRVLLADDNRDAVDSLAMLLEINGHAISVAYNGSEAVTLARQSLPHAMILDIGMPDTTGYEVARQIRAEPWGGSVLLIAVTGWGQKEDKSRAVSAGFDHHLTKPVDMNEVEELLQQFFKTLAAGDSEKFD
jgi:CheY-like chemotaxis protein